MTSALAASSAAIVALKRRIARALPSVVRSALPATAHVAIDARHTAK